MLRQRPRRRHSRRPVFGAIALVVTALAAATISASSPAAGVAGFGDVEEGRFFTEAVQWMVDEDITTGVSPTCFAPDAVATRGQAAAFMWRMEGEPGGSPDHGFADVVADYQQDPVSWMRAEKITTGVTPTQFQPDRPVTRAELAVLLHRLAGTPAATGPGFPDVVAPWAIQAVRWLREQGITTGTGPDTFSPDAPVTRGQLATFFHRYKGEPAVVVSTQHPDTDPCPAQVAGPTPPNIVFILVDDLRFDELELGFNRSLPGRASALEDELIDEGTTLRNFFVSTPLCCPSRASFLTGQYVHNHGVALNGGTGDAGGLRRFYLDDRDETSLGRWLQDAGYTTALIGKYLNGYPDRQGLDALGVTETYVPRGWDEWYATFVNDPDVSFHDFRMNENGIVVEHPADYLTDVEADHAVDFIRRRADDGPFFLYVNAYAPHTPTEPRPDHLDAHADAGVVPPPPPSCEEPDVTDKPAYIATHPVAPWNLDCWQDKWTLRLDMTLAVDELIGAVIDELDGAGVLDNTYVLFGSDNGHLRGEHRFAGKVVPYEESIRVPLIVRGPGVAAGVTLDHLGLNIDMAPTFLHLAGATVSAGSPPVDGESLVPVLRQVVTADEWREAVLIEHVNDATSGIPYVPTYAAVRTLDHLYVEYGTGETELYDLAADPFQLASIHATAPAALIAELSARVDGLKDCAGSECAAATR